MLKKRALAALSILLVSGKGIAQDVGGIGSNVARNATELSEAIVVIAGLFSVGAMLYGIYVFFWKVDDRPGGGNKGRGLMWMFGGGAATSIITLGETFRQTIFG